MLVPLRATRTSPGWMAVPLGMFSVAATQPTTRSGSSSSAAAMVAAMTAAAPPMSLFMVIIPAGVFRDSPPESKVMPLPTRATVALGAGRLVRQSQQPGRFGRPGGDAEQTPEALGLDPVAIPDLDRGGGADGGLGRHPGQLGRGEVPGRAVDPVTGPPGGDHVDLPPVDGRLDRGAAESVAVIAPPRLAGATIRTRSSRPGRGGRRAPSKR